MNDRRRDPHIDSPLLICLVVFAWLLLLIALVYVVFASAPDEPPAGGRAACELVAPESNGAFNPSEVAAESTANAAASP
ncbi:MAG TPA: hypothetical protein PKZ27_03035 [Rhodocyclaceae bacterium]|nr:hypothetical protein [Burkholderiaceae bacterium]HRP74541.1 hypothetical protein [Rhodocyclaceae bacterium]